MAANIGVSGISGRGAFGGAGPFPQEGEKVVRRDVLIGENWFRVQLNYNSAELPDTVIRNYLDNVAHLERIEDLQGNPLSIYAGGKVSHLRLGEALPEEATGVEKRVVELASEIFPAARKEGVPSDKSIHFELSVERLERQGREIDISSLSPSDRRLIGTFVKHVAPEIDLEKTPVLSQSVIKKLLDRNGDGTVDVEDWKSISTPEYPITKAAFRRIADLLSPADLNIDLKVEKGLDPRQQRTAFDARAAIDKGVFGAVDFVEKEKPPTFQRLVHTPKTDLHIHIGGNASPRYLYQQALDRVGPGALDPGKWGGKIDWLEKAYLDFHTFQMVTLDESIRRGKVGKEIAEADFVPPSQLIAEGQEIARKLQTPGLTPENEKSLLEKQEENFKKFERMVIYTPTPGTANLADFLNTYRFTACLVENTTSGDVLAAAVEDNMRIMSEDGVLYADMRVGAPRLKLAKETFPALDDEEAVYQMTRQVFLPIIQAIQSSNAKLIENGMDPADLRLVFALCKTSSMMKENLYQIKALARLLNDPEVGGLCRHYIVGVDGASKEPGELPELYQEHIQVVNDYNESVGKEEKLGLTWHQGEDFTDTSLFNSIYRVEEMIDMGVNRLGHAIVLGIKPELYAGTSFVMTAKEYKKQLEYDKEHGFKGIQQYVKGSRPTIEEEFQRIDELIEAMGPSAKVEGQYPSSGPELQDYIDDVRQRQDLVLAKAKERGVVIETNPTSNLYMAIPSGYLEDHPLPRFVQAGVSIAVNTDDAGTFGTNLNREFVAAAFLGGFSEGKLAKTIADGFNHSFATLVRGQSLEHLTATPEF